LVGADRVASDLSPSSKSPRSPLAADAEGHVMPSGATLSRPAYTAPGDDVEDSELDMETMRQAAFEPYAMLTPVFEWPSAHASDFDVEKEAAPSAKRGIAVARKTLVSQVYAVRERIRRHASSDLPDPNGWAMVVAGLLGACVIARRRAPQ
jgi:hypothetical protein